MEDRNYHQVVISEIPYQQVNERINAFFVRQIIQITGRLVIQTNIHSVHGCIPGPNFVFFLLFAFVGACLFDV